MAFFPSQFPSSIYKLYNNCCTIIPNSFFVQVYHSVSSSLQAVKYINLIHLAHNQYLFLTFRVAQLGYIERSPVKDDKTQKSSPLLANHTSTGAKC